MELSKIKHRQSYLHNSDSHQTRFKQLYVNPKKIAKLNRRVFPNYGRIPLKKIQESQEKYLVNSYWGNSKRIFDIFISSVVTIFILSWLFPILWVIIKLESKGPLLFKQQRNGLNQKPFECYKFRSMEINIYSDSVPTLKKDPRITKVGEFIRKYSIDELPQFINVLKGDMTVVGPRPHMISETNEFNKISSDFYKRHRVKPGITGIAQINNCRGAINNYHDLSRRIKYDLFYIRNATFGYDLQVVYKTFVKMLLGDPKAR